MSSMGRFVSGLAYPFVMVLAYALFAGFTQFGLSITLSAYAAVLIGAVLITLHEIKLPYRRMRGDPLQPKSEPMRCSWEQFRSCCRCY